MKTKELYKSIYKLANELGKKQILLNEQQKLLDEFKKEVEKMKQQIHE